MNYTMNKIVPLAKYRLHVSLTVLAMDARVIGRTSAMIAMDIIDTSRMSSTWVGGTFINICNDYISPFNTI